MSRHVSQGKPAAEQKDLQDAVRIVNRIKGDRRRSPAVKEQMLFHGKALVKLLIDDDAFGAADPAAVDAEAKAKADKKKERRAALDVAVSVLEGNLSNGAATGE